MESKNKNRNNRSKEIAPVIIALNVSGVIPIIVALRWGGKWKASSKIINKAASCCILIGVSLLVDSINRIYYRQQTPLGDRAPEHLVQEGSYKFIRNPMTSGMVLILIGESFVFKKISISIWAVIVCATSLLSAVTVERRVLLSTFGEDYIDYCKRTGALLPKFNYKLRRGK